MRIGVDIGGTKIVAVCVDDDGNILASARRPTQADHSVEVVIGNIHEAIAEVFTDQVRGIGLSNPGYLLDGKVYGSPNNPSLLGTDLKAAVKEKFAVPVQAENDANCFALAEYHLGAGKDSKVMVGIIQGTGVGGGIIINDAVFTGVTGSAGEIGHMPLLGEKDWEALLSGPSIMSRYNELGGVLAEHPGQVWTEDSEPAHTTRDELVDVMGRFLAVLINAFNPDCIVIGGGVSKLPDDYYERIRDAARPHCVTGAFEACTIVRHEVSDDAGVLGAAMLLD